MNYTCNKINTKTITNSERIRNMTDYELAWELMTWRVETVAKLQGDSSNYPDTQATILEWLGKECEVRVDAE